MQYYWWDLGTKTFLEIFNYGIRIDLINAKIGGRCSNVSHARRQRPGRKQ
jgi:hypothetical protein